jgi:GH24 family phage-related lysozyme (muramidase)
MLKKLLAKLKRLGIRPAIVQDYLGGLPSRPGQQPKITPKFTSAQLAIATALTVRARQSYGWAPPPKIPATGSVLVVAGKGIILTGPKGDHVARPSLFHPMPVSRITLADAFSFTFGNEGRFEHMYADVNGVVTVGIGHAIFRPQDARKLPFVRKDTGAAATQAEIDKDYNAVVGTTNHVASYFEPLTDLELSQADIDGLLQADFNTHINIAQAFFSLDQLPQPVQIALFDLAFQTGGNLAKGITFGNLQDALRRRDWARAGKEMDVNHPHVDTRRNLARLNEASKAATPRSYFTTDPAKTEPLLDHLLRP